MRTPDLPPFAQLLREYRLAAGLSQEELAERAALSARGISDLERGARRRPRSDTVRALAQALGLRREQAAALEAEIDRRRGPHLPTTVAATPPGSAPIQAREAEAAARSGHLSTLIGREREQAEVKRLLAETPLLTLTGPGGAGKTRLALAVAAQVADDYRDGVVTAELASLAEPELVPQLVAQAAGVREGPSAATLATLAGALEPRELLLVLDNCEHLVDACAELSAELLGTCPRLRILATSREVLRVDGELSWHVPPLSLPRPGDLPSTGETLARYEAVRLFVERARSRQPGFAFMHENAARIVEICRRLGGLPLGIELAAARVGVLGVEQLAARLDDSLGILGGGSRTAPERQRTLRAALDWSYDLLPEPERRLLARLFVFAGGWELEAAEAVCAAPVDAGSQGTGDVLQDIFQLVDKSLVVAEVDAAGGVRYRLLEPVRQYARERIEQGGGDEAATLQAAHASWYSVLAARADREWRGSRQQEWLERLEIEHDNLRAALRWYLDRGDAEAGLCLGGYLLWFWEMRGYLGEIRTWMGAGLSAGAALSPEVRARALGALGSVAWQQGEYERAAALHEESLALARGIGYERGVARALNNLGLVSLDRGGYERARALFEESLRLRRELRDSWGVAVSLGNLGSVALQEGRYGEARERFEQSLAIRREQENAGGIALSLQYLGTVAMYQGDYERAEEMYAQGLELKRRLGDKVGIAALTYNLGRVALLRGEHRRAELLIGESLTRWRALGDRTGTAECLEALAVTAGTRNGAERAARLWGAAAAIRTAIGAPLAPVEQELYARVPGASRARFDEAASRRGYEMSPDEAIEYALRRLGGA